MIQATRGEEEEGDESSRAKSSSRSSSKDPRISRVSRALGTKDRHSKVYTVKGVRDRRVRLSVETAIQLYDLQDRLGLNQPSKVVDWLLNVAKNAIDELPPLHFPPQPTFFSMHDVQQQQQQQQPFLTDYCNPNPFFRFEEDPSSNLTLSSRTFDHHHQELHNFGVVQWPSILPSHQVVVYRHPNREINSLQQQQQQQPPLYFPCQQRQQEEEAFESSISLALPAVESRNGRPQQQQ